ncbi:MAG: hypothetical protein HPM95_20865 [Alphaproteobacteria bacterium]|nr:hypothetical protein [Alphaproteobacteria bacterium]
MHAAAQALTALNKALFFRSPSGWSYAIAGLMLFGVFPLQPGKTRPQTPRTRGHPAVRPVLPARRPICCTAADMSPSISFRHAPASSSGRAEDLRRAAGLLFSAILLWFSARFAHQSYTYAETSYSAWNPVIWPVKAVRARRPAPDAAGAGGTCLSHARAGAT